MSGAAGLGAAGEDEEVAQNGQFELYKTSHHFDTTEKKPQYLG